MRWIWPTSKITFPEIKICFSWLPSGLQIREKLAVESVNQLWAFSIICSTQRQSPIEFFPFHFLQNDTVWVSPFPFRPQHIQLHFSASVSNVKIFGLWFFRTEGSFCFSVLKLIQKPTWEFSVRHFRSFIFKFLFSKKGVFVFPKGESHPTCLENAFLSPKGLTRQTSHFGQNLKMALIWRLEAYCSLKLGCPDFLISTVLAPAPPHT